MSNLLKTLGVIAILSITLPRTPTYIETNPRKINETEYSSEQDALIQRAYKFFARGQVLMDDRIKAKFLEENFRGMTYDDSEVFSLWPDNSEAINISLLSGSKYQRYLEKGKYGSAGQISNKDLESWLKEKEKMTNRQIENWLSKN